MTKMIKHYETCTTLDTGSEYVKTELSPEFLTKGEAAIWAVNYLSRFKGEKVFLRELKIVKLDDFNSPEIKYLVNIRLGIKEQEPKNLHDNFIFFKKD